MADASVFILGKEIEGEVITVPSVEKELKDIRSRLKFQISNVRIESPSREAMKRAIQGAKETGDIERLSLTDLELLAKALECQGILATDDYALQNSAAHLGIRVEVVVQRGIKRKLVRTPRCYACGETFQGDHCPSCGTPIKKARRR